MITTIEYWLKSNDHWEHITVVNYNGSKLFYANGILQENKPMLEVEEGTHTISTGEEYYSVRVNGRMYYGDYNVWEDMIVWATDTFGPTPGDGIWTVGARWYVNNARFWFKNKKDLDWFMLRWA